MLTNQIKMHDFNQIQIITKNLEKKHIFICLKLLYLKTLAGNFTLHLHVFEKILNL
jgi:hypothetical protein